MIEGRTDIVKDPFSTITARNVPFKATEAEIVHFFGQAGKVGVRGVLDCSLLSPPDHEGCYQWVQECSREFDCLILPTSMLFAEANLHGLRVTLLHDAQVVDVIRTMNREGKLNTWVSVQYATPEVCEIAVACA